MSTIHILPNISTLFNRTTGPATHKLHASQRAGTKHIYSEKIMSTTLRRKCLSVFWWCPSTIILDQALYTTNKLSTAVSSDLFAIAVRAVLTPSNVHHLVPHNQGPAVQAGQESAQILLGRRYGPRGTSHPSSEDSHRSRRKSFPPGLPQS